MVVGFGAASLLAFGGPRTSSVINAPAGTANGQHLTLMFSHVAAGTRPPLIATPLAGWTVEKTIEWDYPGTGLGRTYLLTRPANSEPASYTINHASGYTWGVMVARTGVKAGHPLDVDVIMATGNTAAAGAAAFARSRTPRTDGALVSVMRQSWDGAAAAPTQDWTERVDNAAGYVQDLQQTTRESTGHIVLPAGNNAGAGKPWITATIVYRDAAAADPAPYVPSWKTAIAAAAAGTGQARIAVVLNSFGEGEGVDDRDDRWLDLLVHDLRETMGIPGHGLGHTPPRYNTYLDVSAGWRTPATATPAIASKVFARAAGQSFAYPIVGDAFTVVYDGRPGLGPISVSVDGGAAETIPAKSSGRAHRWHKTGLAPGAHTVTLTAGTGGAEILGIEPYRDGDSPTVGLTYLDWTWSGDHSGLWVPGAAHDVTGMRYAPHLIIDGKMGANDHLRDLANPGTGASPDTVQQRTADRLAEYLSLPSMPLVMPFVLPVMPAGSAVDETAVNSFGARLEDYRNAHADVAADFGLQDNVLDCRELLTLTLDDLVDEDDLHLGVAGQQAIATGIRMKLLEASGYEPMPLFVDGARVKAAYSDGREVIKIMRDGALVWPKGDA